MIERVTGGPEPTLPCCSQLTAPHRTEPCEPTHTHPNTAQVGADRPHSVVGPAAHPMIRCRLAPPPCRLLQRCCGSLCHADASPTSHEPFCSNQPNRTEPPARVCRSQPQPECIRVECTPFLAPFLAFLPSGAGDGERVPTTDASTRQLKQRWRKHGRRPDPPDWTTGSGLRVSTQAHHPAFSYGRVDPCPHCAIYPEVSSREPTGAWCCLVGGQEPEVRVCVPKRGGARLIEPNQPTNQPRQPQQRPVFPLPRRCSGWLGGQQTGTACPADQR